MEFVKALSLCFLAVSAANAAEILSASRPKDVIPNEYIIVMRNGVSATAFSSHRAWVADIHHSNITRRGLPRHGIHRTYDFHQMKGYSGTFDEDTLREIAQNPDVAFIEPNQIVRIADLVEQRNAPSWGLGRVSVKKNQQLRDTHYYYDSSAGEGIWGYDIDTGVDITHPDFEGRAVWGSNHIDNSDTDGHGHGTHVGGTMGSKTYGVAKKLKIIAVKVLGANGAGTNAAVVAGIDWSVNHAKQHGMLEKSVMNLSLGGGVNAATNMAVANAHKAGMHVAVAAGNERANAETSSPASEPLICTVASSDVTDIKSWFSNFGALVDIFAPGSSIISLAPGNQTRTLSGTSMASPHVAGVGAYLMALEKIPGNKVCDRLKELAHPAVRMPGDRTTNKLLYNNSGK